MDGHEDQDKLNKLISDKKYFHNVFTSDTAKLKMKGSMVTNRTVLDIQQCVSIYKKHKDILRHMSESILFENATDPTVPIEKPEYGSHQTFRHLITNEKMDKYEVMFHDEEEYQSYLDSFNWRTRQDNIVKTVYLN